jgi:hypothetical protein
MYRRVAAIAAITFLLPFASAQTYFKLVRTEVTKQILSAKPITTTEAGGKKAIELVTTEPGFTSRANINVAVPDRVASDQENFTVSAKVECTWDLKNTVTNLNVGLNVMGVPKHVAKGDPGPWPTAGKHTLEAEAKAEANFASGFGVRKWTENGATYRQITVGGHSGVVQGLSGFTINYVYQLVTDTTKTGDVEVMEISGEVDVSPGGDDSKIAPLKKGAKVNTWDRIITGLGSKLKLRFADGTIVDVGELTDMKVNCFIDAGDAVQTRLWLRAGEVTLSSDSKERPSGFEVKTPTSVCGRRGTVFTVKHNKVSGITTVRVTQGQVDVAPADPSLKPILLGPGESADVSLDRIVRKSGR